LLLCCTDFVIGANTTLAFLFVSKGRVRSCWNSSRLVLTPRSATAEEELCSVMAGLCPQVKGAVFVRGVQAYRFQATAATISASSQPDSSVLHITGSTVASSFVCSECFQLV
jgi:hypothetical protein